MKLLISVGLSGLLLLASGCNKSIPNSRSNPYPIGVENPTYGDVLLVVPREVVINSINGERADLFALTRKKQAYIALPEGRHQIEFKFRGIVGSIFGEESRERVTIAADFEGFRSYTLGMWPASMEKPPHFGGDVNFALFRNDSGHRSPVPFEIIERKEKYK